MTYTSDKKRIESKPSRFVKRRSRGFTQMGGLVNTPIRAVTERRGFSEIRVLTHWAEVVGQNLANISRPIKVSYSRDGFGATLTVLADGARAPELQMMLPDLKDKINACYGYNAIARIRITQTSEQGFAEQSEGFEHQAPTPKKLSDKVANELSETLAPIGDDRLRAALENLAKNVLTK